MFSLIYIYPYPYLENIIIFCSEHWDCGSSTVAGCSSLEPYYGIYTAVLFIKTVTPSQNHRNLILIMSTKKVPNPESRLVFSWRHGRNGVKLIYPREESSLRCFAFSLKLTKVFIFLPHHSFRDRLGLGAAGLGNVWFLRDPQSGCGLPRFLFLSSTWSEN